MTSIGKYQKLHNLTVDKLTWKKNIQQVRLLIKIVDDGIIFDYGPFSSDVEMCCA